MRVGTISDIDYAGYPDLNQELFDASDVFVKWCNSAGGINRHLIQLDKLDAKVGYLTGALPATTIIIIIIINKKQYQEAGATLGWKALYDDQYNAMAESNWLPFTQAGADRRRRQIGEAQRRRQEPGRPQRACSASRAIAIDSRVSRARKMAS
jgi:hypothetical protein